MTLSIYVFTYLFIYSFHSDVDPEDSTGHVTFRIS